MRSQGLDFRLTGVEPRLGERPVVTLDLRRLRLRKLALIGEMSADIAHRIRNPLTIIGGYARRLLKGGLSAEQRQGIEIILRQSELIGETTGERQLEEVRRLRAAAESALAGAEAFPKRWHWTSTHYVAGSAYASGYYAYLWAEVLDCDAFDAFVEAGDVFDTAVAARLREWFGVNVRTLKRWRAWWRGVLAERCPGCSSLPKALTVMASPSCVTSSSLARLR